MEVDGLYFTKLGGFVNFEGVDSGDVFVEAPKMCYPDSQTIRYWTKDGGVGGGGLGSDPSCGLCTILFLRIILFVTDFICFSCAVKNMHGIVYLIKSGNAVNESVCAISLLCFGAYSRAKVIMCIVDSFMQVQSCT